MSRTVSRLVSNDKPGVLPGCGSATVVPPRQTQGSPEVGYPHVQSQKEIGDELVGDFVIKREDDGESDREEETEDTDLTAKSVSGPDQPRIRLSVR